MDTLFWSLDKLSLSLTQSVKVVGIQSDPTPSLLFQQPKYGSFLNEPSIKVQFLIGVTIFTQKIQT